MPRTRLWMRTCVHTYTHTLKWTFVFDGVQINRSRTSITKIFDSRLLLRTHFHLLMLKYSCTQEVLCRQWYCPVIRCKKLTHYDKLHKGECLYTMQCFLIYLTINLSLNIKNKIVTSMLLRFLYIHASKLIKSVAIYGWQEAQRWAKKALGIMLP